MLTAIGRVAIGRLATTSSHRFAISRVRVAAAYGQFNPSHPSLNVARGFAAARAASKSTTAAKKPAAKKTTTAAAKKSTKVQAKAKAKPKAKAKAKAKAKPKAKAKAKAKLTPKSQLKSTSRSKRLTDEERATLQRRELKQAALFTEPKSLPEGVWVTYVTEQTKAKQRAPAELRKEMQHLAENYKSMPSSERQRLEKTAEQNKQANAVAYKAWVESHTPSQIAAANRARNLLKRKFGFPSGHVKLITDDRLPKRPLTAFSIFTKTQWSSPNPPSASGGIQAASTAIASLWKSLSEADKKQYFDLSKTDNERYEKAVKATLGREVTSRKSASP